MHSASLRVNSETGLLRKVVIHRPDDGIELITPGSAVELLYEDIVFLPKMQTEHDIFTSALRCFTGDSNVLEVQDMLADILKMKDLRQELLEKLALMEQLSSDMTDYLKQLNNENLAKVLFSGAIPDQQKLFFSPLPNFIFTRDTGVILNDHLLLPRAAMKPRHRESLLCSYIYRYHEEFRSFSDGGKVLDFSCYGTEMAIEGGDVMMVGPGHLMVATSERTTVDAAEKLINIALEKKIVEQATRVDMPKMRACMHLDTIFTRISKKLFVGYDPLTGSDAMDITHYTSTGKAIRFSSLKSLFADLSPEALILPCADGETPYAEREQWTDACNFFAVKDGVAFTYDRNYRTNRALQKKGFSLITAEDFLEQVKQGAVNPQELEQAIITIPSSELSRARGGPHCLTMPILRV